MNEDAHPWARENSHPNSRPLADRFNEKWIGEPNSGCWLWTGCTARNKETGFEYGQLWVNGKMERAHAVAWFLHYGALPSSETFLCHRCDTPICVNPNHLFLGTQLDNMRDCIAKDRNARGERQGHAKLDAAQIYEIRASKEPKRQLARRFGVTPHAIRLIKNRVNWKHLPEECVS